MPESLEDRIFAAGRHEEFKAAIEAFEKSNRGTVPQQVLYDRLEQLGASPEEADEFVNMVVENG
jgi:Ca2+-binding EF-hand superfamily protein